MRFGVESVCATCHLDHEVTKLREQLVITVVILSLSLKNTPTGTPGVLILCYT